MAKLTRVTGKVFAGSAPLNEIGQFGSALAGNPTNTQDVATIQALSAYDGGWNSAVITSRNYPPIEEVNGVLKTISYQTCYMLQEGIPEYDVGTEYSNTSIVKRITGTALDFFISLQNNNIGHPLSDSNYWAQASLSAGRNVGEIITSTIPLNDSGLHLLDGALIEGTGVYESFVNYIASIYDSASSYFTDETTWQNSVNKYGSCGKFVYNATNNTVRLPRISSILQGTTDISALGNLTEAGIPNITGGFTARGIGGQYSTLQDPTGVFYISTTTPTGDVTGTGGTRTGSIYTFNASRSSAIYGKSNTVQPQTIKVLYYIVIATSEKTDIEVDIDNIVTDLNGKADIDLSNVTVTNSFATVLNNAGIRTVVESYRNGTSWYQIWSDGKIEQGGIADRGSYKGSGNFTVALLKPFSDTSYSVLCSMKDGDISEDHWVSGSINPYNYTTSSFTLGFYCSDGSDRQRYAVWEAKGY